MILDTHYHLDFLPADVRGDVVIGLAAREIAVVAQTLTPTAFDATATVAGALPSVGWHPWYLDPARVAEELATFEAALTRTRFIGEVGLDLTPRRLAAVPAQTQIAVLEQILGLVGQAARRSDEPYVLSLHAVRSVGAVLDTLERVGPRNVVPVVHWFSGTSDELTRLVRLGGYVSVNPHHLDSKRGRAYVSQIPVERLLLESDLPTEEQAMCGDAEQTVTTLVDVLTTTLARLSELRGADVTAPLLATQQRLYGID